MDEMTHPSFRWLNLSDFHAKMRSQDWLWPTFRFQFFEDIKRVHESVGAWDLVIFSGDFADKAAPAEYEVMTKVLEDLWGLFKQMGFAPKLIITPGNHDIARPPEDDPEFIVLDHWWGNSSIHDQFYSGGRYLDYINRAFGSYTQWAASEFITEILVPDCRQGLLPGDSSFIMKTSLGQVGVICLNSTWLQLGNATIRGDCTSILSS